MTATLISAVKDEGPDLLEWAAYHRAIGFERIVVWSNDCTDGSDRLLDALEGIGWLTHRRHTPPPDVHAQDAVARLALDDPALQAGWMIWLDADEFLNVTPGAGRVDDLIDAIGDADAVALNWRLFGDGGHTHSPAGLVMETFTSAAAIRFRLCRTVKTLFRRDSTIANLFIHRPVWTATASPLVLDGAGRPLGPEFIHGQKENGRPEEMLAKGRPDYTLGRINHYAVKALDRVAMKRLRGNGLGPASRFGFSYLRRFNRNEEEDRSILRWLPPTRALMDQALANPAVARAHADSAALFAAKLASVRELTETFAADRTGATHRDGAED